MRRTLIAAILAGTATPALATDLACVPEQVCGEGGCTSQEMDMAIRDFEGARPQAEIAGISFRLQPAPIEPPRIAFTGSYGGLPVSIEVDKSSGSFGWSHGDSFLVIGTCAPEVG